MLVPIAEICQPSTRRCSRPLFFMTLGSLQVNPRAGVLFIDFDSGDLLTLTGTAEVVWGGEELSKR